MRRAACSRCPFAIVTQPACWVAQSLDGLLIRTHNVVEMTSLRHWSCESQGFRRHDQLTNNWGGVVRR